MWSHSCARFAAPDGSGDATAVDLRAASCRILGAQGVCKSGQTHERSPVPVAQVVEVPRLDLLTRPRGLAQKRKARRDGRVDGEASNVDARGKLFPTMSLNERCEDGLESESMQWIARL